MPIIVKKHIHLTLIRVKYYNKRYETCIENILPL